MLSSYQLTGISSSGAGTSDFRDHHRGGYIMFSGVVDEPSKTEEEKLKNIERSTKVLHDQKNPCIKEHAMSFKCLEDFDYDRNKCAWYFENYKKCKEFWGDIRVQRRRAGIVPNLPPAEERDEIKREYLEKLRSEANK